MTELNDWIDGYLFNSEDYFRNADIEELREEFKSEYDTDLTDNQIDAEIGWAQKHGEVER